MLGGRNKKNIHQVERLYEEYGPRIYNFVVGLSNGDRYLAEEVTQITFHKLFEKIDTLSSIENQKKYLFTIARNVLINLHKRETIEWVYKNYILSNAVIHDYSTENMVNHDFLWEFLQELIEDLPPIRRSVFTMSRFKNMRNKEIADELGIAESTVETHMTLALRYLRDSISKHYGKDS